MCSQFPGVQERWQPLKTFTGKILNMYCINREEDRYIATGGAVLALRSDMFAGT